MSLRGRLAAGEFTVTAELSEGTLMSGRELDPPPEIFLGAVENPFAPPEGFRAERAGKKIAAGAQFMRTQYVFDVPLLRRWVLELGELGLLGRCSILAGVGVIRSVRALDFMASGRVPGVRIPEDVRRRLRGAGESNVGAEGMKLAAEVIAAVRQILGVAGVHLLTAGYEKHIPELPGMAGADRSADRSATVGKGRGGD